MQWKLGPGAAVVVVVVVVVVDIVVVVVVLAVAVAVCVGDANNCNRIQTPFSIFNNKQVQTDMKAKLGDQFEAVKVTTFLFACKSHTYHASHT